MKESKVMPGLIVIVLVPAPDTWAVVTSIGFHSGIITAFLDDDVPCSSFDDIVEGNDEILIEGDTCRSV